MYAYMSGGGQEPEILKAAKAGYQFGFDAIFGRVMTVKEVRHMQLAIDVNNAYLSREANKTALAKWAEDHPYWFSLLNFGKTLVDNA